MFYLVQWWIPLIIVGISWISLVTTWSFSVHQDVYSKAMACFTIESGHSKKLLKTFFSRFSNDFEIILYSIPWAVFIILYILLARERIFLVPQEIFENILLNTLLLTYSFFLGLVTAYYVGFGVYTVSKHTQNVRDISKFSLKMTPLAIRCKTGLHNLVRLSFLASVTWFVDVVFGIILIITIVDIMTVAGIAVLTIIGLLILLLPQVFLRGSILRYKEETQSQIIQKFGVLWEKLDENLGKPDLNTLCELFDHIESIEGWPFGKSHTLNEVLAALFPLAGSIVGFLLSA